MTAAVYLFSGDTIIADRYNGITIIADMLGGGGPPSLEPYYTWCKQNVGASPETWRLAGTSLYNFRILFVDPADALAFKLKFGL